MHSPQCQVGDDVGTEYRARGGGSGGSGGGADERVGRTRFTPAPPSNASRITVQ